MGYVQLVIGLASSGKSTYCNNLHQHCESIGRTVNIVNFDPTVENFDYLVSIDIRDLFSLEDVMEEMIIAERVAKSTVEDYDTYSCKGYAYHLTRDAPSASAVSCDPGFGSAIKDKGKRIVGFASLLTAPTIHEEAAEMPQVVYENIDDIPALAKTYSKTPPQLKRKRGDEDLSELRSVVKSIDFDDPSVV
ncbi:uncharacterized protein LOC131858247 [Cryptomeria japonica]|uniref:uncharacterized protein LOC131858247 n=1 Tax=Cryptomeria japonica TaxID=3369 RepID=UPI0027D9FD0F|nr:uncharacterized protein LOC131858247 [Cryptomeria japonica]